MKTFLLAIFALGAGGLVAAAQTNPPVPATLAPSAISSNEFPHSDLAVLSDDTRVDVQANGSFTATRHVRSKILTSRGRKTAEVIVPFNQKYQEVEFHFARSTQPDGTERAVKPDDIETAAAYPANPAYGDVRVTRYVVRGVEVGSVLDQEYTLKAKATMPEQFWMVWRLRTAAPVVQSKLILRIPASRKFRWRVHNLDLQPQVAGSADKQWTTYTWTYSAPKEIVAEPYMPSPDDLFPWLEASTVGSWDDLGQWLYDISEPQIDSAPELQNHMRLVTANLTTPADKIAAIYYWVEDNIRFVSVELGMSGYKPRPASQTLLSRYGDSKDMSVLLAAMLRDAGIQARLAFLESGSARTISDRLPMARQLTHCIVVAEANGKTYYLDPTAETARYDVVLGRLCYTELLLLGKGANKLVPSPTYIGAQHGTKERVRVALAADGSITGELRTSYSGESDGFIRASLKYTLGEQLQNLIEREVQTSLPKGKLLNFEVADVSDRSKDFVTQYRFESPAWADAEAGALRFKAQLAQRIDVSVDMFNKGDRQFPFLFYESAPSAVDMEITLPAGFKVESLPKDVNMENAFSYWKRTIREEGNRVLVNEVSYMKTARLPKESVTDIRKYYEEAVARKNDVIVLRKK